MEHAELVVKVNEAGPRVAIALDGLANSFGRFELMGGAEHVQATVVILIVKGNDVVGLANAGSASRPPTDDECQAAFVIV